MLGIPAKLLARVVNKVETVDLTMTIIYANQLEEIFRLITEGKSTMKHLGLGHLLDWYPPDLVGMFAKAVNKLESVDLLIWLRSK